MEGVYDVDLIEGEMRTKDAESNYFRVRSKNDIIKSMAMANQRSQFPLILEI